MMFIRGFKYNLEKNNTIVQKQLERINHDL